MQRCLRTPRIGPVGFAALVGLAAVAFGAAPAQATAPGANGKIVFASNRDGDGNDFDLFAMNPDGSGVTPVTNDAVTSIEPAYSPDGAKIAYTTTSGDGSPGNPANREIIVVDADGSDPVNVTNSPTSDDSDPSFSPDGTKIAFRRQVGIGDTGEIYIVDSDGSDLKRLTQNSLFDAEPTWSPDGSKVIFNEVIAGNNEIVQKDASSADPASAPENLTNNVQNDSNPSVSPDGRIAFSRLNSTDYDVYVMDADGTDQTNITNNSASWDSQPAFSPDGEKIAFTRGAFNSMDIWVMGANGASPVNLTPGQATPRQDSHPDWQPVADGDGDGVADFEDACPDLAGARANGCPGIARTLTLKYAAGAFRGLLTSTPPQSECFADRTVSVWKKVGAIGGPDDVKRGEDATSATGKYVVAKRKRPGKYYAQVSEETFATLGSCLAARSPLLTLP
jgi:Tol biopolymer transport system component